MNRRQFLGASFGAAIASAVLPWDRFIEWCKSWLGFDRAGPFLKAKAADIDAMYEAFGDQMAQTLWGTATITAVDRINGTFTVSA